MNIDGIYFIYYSLKTLVIRKEEINERGNSRRT